MTKRNELILSALIAVALIAFVGFVASIDKSEPEPDPELSGNTEICFYEVIMPGDRIVETGPGEYEYTFIVSKRGIEVWRPCK